MKKEIEQYREVVMQIATPFSTGTGFFLVNEGLVVTNEHIVRGNREVVVEGVLLPRQLAKVVFTDPLFDLAFLRCTTAPSIKSVSLSERKEVAEGEVVYAVGHTFGLQFTVEKGIISNPYHKENDFYYYQHDAIYKPGNSGGPLVDSKGFVVGVNTFIATSGDEYRFSLPSVFLKNSINEFNKIGKGRIGSRCLGCFNLVFDDTNVNTNCPQCGSKVNLPHQEEEYEAVGIPLTIEKILESCGHEIILSRRGPHLWEIIEGSAKIHITYYEPNGLIAGDAMLCYLPESDILPVYEYLLRQNHLLEGLTLSVKGHEIVLSLIIYDRYLSISSGKKMFKWLFQKADELDNVLVEQFNCRWKD